MKHYILTIAISVLIGCGEKETNDTSESCAEASEWSEDFTMTSDEYDAFLSEDGGGFCCWQPPCQADGAGLPSPWNRFKTLLGHVTLGDHGEPRCH